VAAENELQNRLVAFKDTRQKLSQIQQWEPIIRGRLPCSAVLAAIEQTVPADAVLEKVALESSRYQALPVAGGTYRVPEVYTLSIQGSLRFGHAEELETFTNELTKHLPAGAQVVRSKLLEGPESLVPFLLVYAITPTGNYSALGVQRIADPDRL
jgi:hypothetical protein